MLKCTLAVFFVPKIFLLFNNKAKQILADPLKMAVNRLIPIKTDDFPAKKGALI